MLLKKHTYRLLGLLVLSILLIQVYVLYNVGNIVLYAAAADSIITSVFLSLSVWGVLLVIRNYPVTIAILLHSLLISTVFSLAVCFFDWQALKIFLGADYGDHMLHSLSIRWLVIWLVNSWIATYTAFQQKTSVLEGKFQQYADASILLREAELFKLRQQLQPHFLYNSLNSISALIMIQPDKAQEMVGKLSDFLRSSVKREAEDQINIDDELEYIQSYLAIEAIRFGDRLNIEFEKEYTDDAAIPPFLLQPILENAIKFGLYSITGSVTIKIHIRLQGALLRITVTNPYDAATSYQKGTGFGLEGIQRRLYLLYARTDLLEIKKEENLFITTLKIPQAHA